MTSKCEICLETYTEDQLVSVGDCERFNREKAISVVCSNCYDKDAGFYGGRDYAEEDYTEERCDTCKKVLTYGDEQGCDCEEEDVGTKGYEPEQLEEGEKVWVSRIEEEDISQLSDKEYIFWLEHKIDKLEEEIRNGDTDKCGCGHCGKQIDLTIVNLVI